jgi:hypothetical protein
MRASYDRTPSVSQLLPFVQKKLWKRMLNLSDQVAGGLQSKPLAREHGVYSNEHHPRQHDLTASALVCRWQRQDGEHFWVI